MKETDAVEARWEVTKLHPLHLKFLEDDEPSYPAYLADAFHELKRQGEVLEECRNVLAMLCEDAPQFYPQSYKIARTLLAKLEGLLQIATKEEGKE